ncbi:hypothetical protein B0H19DRAFT_998676 [Mycena capillaripes]|nr:hypothetical protein B0H19DRAFT_998676 [Mycena capillaripes]
MSDAAPLPAVLVDLDPDESRVYFGPFKSPEKKYLGPGLAVTQPATPSPLRRSPRLSSPIPNPFGQSADEDEGDNRDEDDDEDLSRSRSGTPDNDRWQPDEPSSVLATRITRAHDNPSPPPAAPVQDFDSGPPTPVLYPTSFIIPDSSSALSRGGSPFAPRPPPSPQNNLQHDLISFDSFSTSVDLLSTQPIASTSFIPPETHNPSVDELLSSWSPSARDTPAASVSPPPSEVEGGSSKGKARASPESTPDTAEEQAVANALIFPDALDSAPSLQADTPNVDPQPSDNDIPRTPLRRSTRPRRSTTPHAHLVPLPSSDDESPARTHLTPSSALTKKKRRKGTEGNTAVVPETSNSQRGEADLLNGTSSMSEEDWEMKRRRERGERKQAMANGTPRTLLQRQLGSLSPGSANLLTQLLPPSKPSPVREQDESLQPTFSFSVFPVVNPAHTTPVRMTSPIRTSPERRAKPRSPNRIQFQAPSLSDPNRTPARRIPVEQAVARGQISPQKGAQLLTNNLDAVGTIPRAPVFHIPPQDSPARRVNVAVPSADQGKWQGMRFGSPTRGRSRERSGSVEPRPPWNGSGSNAGPSDLGASASKLRSSPSRSSSAPLKKGNLPFPLTPSGSDRPAPIPELDEKILSPNTDATAPSPVLGVIKVSRSNLKQPTSRIPRIGTKPYARPAAKPPSDKGGKAPAAATRQVVETAREPPSKTIKVARTGSGSSSDDMKTAEAGASGLKRKRVPSPQTRARPVVLIRQVVPTKFASKPVPVQTAPSPVKRPAVAKFRMVDLHARPVDADPKPPNTESSAEPTPAPEPEPVLVDPLRSPPVSSPPPVISPEFTNDPAPQPPSSPPPDAAEPGTVRRTTRLRKSVFPASTSASASAGPQPLPTRRKVGSQQPPSGSGVFAGMTAVALKALTSSNTTKNQKYLAAKLETEVVRMEGERPESPAVKIRTIAQREQDEKGTQRKARAARRARRSEDGFSEGEGDAGDESAADTYSDMDSSPVRRHRRGPGDEEDYETPKMNGSKRARAGSMDDDDGPAEKKRVKWDRGLSTAVYLDEVEPRTMVHPKENMVKKGCLAPTAKAIRLDPLGNHPNAESPLKDLVEENIIVKKFVYDNDEPALPVVVVKNTRSKAKKKS